MTARELIKALQDLGEEWLDTEVQVFDEYRYRIVTEPIITTDTDDYGEEETFIELDKE